MKGSAYTPPLVSNSSDFGRLVRVRIREATRRDLLGILGIERLAFDHPWSLDSFVRELSLPFSRTTVAIAERQGNENLVGYLCRWVVADECHVLNVAVDPEIRRQGIGARLMYDAIAEARLKQAHLVTLEVRRSNLAARSLYRKLHFRERRLRRNYYGPGEDAIVMELELSDQ